MDAVSPTLPFTVASAPVSSHALISDVRELVERPCEAPHGACFVLGCLLYQVCQPCLIVSFRKLPVCKICSNQAEAWADDELRYFLQQTVDGGPADLKLMYWDPLALTSVVRFANFNLLQELIASVPQEATVLSACVIEGHWYAVCWKCEADSVKAFYLWSPVQHVARPPKGASGVFVPIAIARWCHCPFSLCSVCRWYLLWSPCSCLFSATLCLGLIFRPQ